MFFNSDKKRKRERDQQQDPYGLTIGGLSTGQSFDLVDTGVDVITRGMGKGGALNWGSTSFGMLDVALSTGTAPRGRKAVSGISAVGAQAAGISVFGVSQLAGEAMGAALGSFVPGVGTLVGGFLGGVIAGGASQLIADRIVRRSVFRGITGLINSRPQVRFGGFQDSQPAYTMRQVASRELRSSRMAARKYLGREAALMHQ